MFACVPVRELEIEPCNKRCAFPDRIAETSFTAPPAKEGRLMLLIMQSFFPEEHFRRQYALDNYNPVNGDYEDKSGGCFVFCFFYS